MIVCMNKRNIMTSFLEKPHSAGNEIDESKEAKLFDSKEGE